MTGGALIAYDAACRALAAARTVDEARDIRNRSEAVRAYARQAKNRQLEIDAAEIRMRAERRLGEFIVAQRDTVGLHKGGRPAKTPADTAAVSKATLAEAGVDYKLSARAQKLAAVPERDFEAMVGEWRDRVSAETERVTVRLLREGAIAERDAALAKVPTVWPSGKYPVLYADPAWRNERPAMGLTDRSIEMHYPTMPLEEILALPVADIAADDAVLFLWVTAPQLDIGFDVITAWGFQYRTNLVWDKTKISTGYYVRNQHEHLLIAKRGALPVPAPPDRPPSMLREPRRGHSEKPDGARAAIERMYPDHPKVELFARAAAPGWSVWGNQAAANGVRADAVS